MSDDKIISQIHLRCTPEEKKRLVEKAKKSRLSISQYILTLSKNKKIYVVKGIPELNKQVLRIGTNINQIAMAVNTNKTVSEKQLDIVHSNLLELQGLLHKVLEEIINARDEEIKV